VFKSIADRYAGMLSVCRVVSGTLRADTSIANARLTATLPPQSVTLFVVPKGAANQPPVSYPFATPGGGQAPITINLSGSMSYDNDGTIVSYAWTFGDGGAATGSAVSHTYGTPGVYQARLTVTDDKGATGSDFVTITVTGAPVTVAAPTSLTASVSGKTVTLRFTDKSSNEEGFYVERGVSGKKSTTWTRVATLGPNVTSFAQTVSSGTWLYRVQAFKGSTLSAYSNQVSARVR
jgi:PKD repeat protein